MSSKSGASGGFRELIQTAIDAGKLSSREIAEAINEFRRLYAETEERERREEQARKRAEAERLAREEQEREQAHIAAVTSMELPTDWENAFQSDVRTQGVHPHSIPDALIRSLTELGRVDIEYISAITGADLKTVIVTLRGSIYQNPVTWDECFYKGWETSDEYLSGNLMRKRKEAKEANRKYDGYFSENLKAIDAVLPPAVAADDIYVTLGSPWVPADVIDDFIEDVFGAYRYGYRSSGYWIDTEEQSHTIHDELTGTWEIPNKSRYRHSARVCNTYGTDRIEALHILERTLNMKSVAVTDEIDCPANASGKKRILNEAETAAAIEKQQKLIRKFQRWVWTDPKRKNRLERIFAERYSCVRRRIFDGSFQEFPGMSTSVQLYPYQKNAVARILFSPNTLLAHDVGAGKTYIMIAAGQELRRTGLSKKNMFVVPNNLVGQWRQIFTEMYPSAKLLCADPKSFSPKKRYEVLKQMRDGDYDGILIAYSCFGQIPLSKNYCIDALREKIDRLREQNAKTKYGIPRLKTMIKTLGRKLASLEAEAEDAADKIYFDELGITRLFVDEAHNFKNVPIDTKTEKVLGINSSGSMKCLDMMEKVHMVQKQNDGKGAVLATGTPVTNSVTDVFIMQSYLQSGELGMLDLQSFDGWAGMFAEQVTEFEIDVDTGSYRLATRFARFHNLPELTALLSSVADFHEVDQSAGIPDCGGHHDSVIAKTPEFADYLLRISERAEDVRKGRVKRTEDNMLKITGDGRKAALDMRLVDSGFPFTYQSKVARCAENAADIFHKTAADHSTQLIFCDVSTPKAGFNIYDELKRLLTGMGVPAEQIAYIHDAETEKQRSLLFSKVRSGAVRILIGSTFKLGLGVNVQDRLIALHHIDVPWRPADMTQREGRILRQGNQNSKVYIYRYITEGSFDAYSWQLLETKQRFINDLLSGSLAQRSGSDIEDTVLDYAEVKALAVGNPLVKKEGYEYTAEQVYQMFIRQGEETVNGRTKRVGAEVQGVFRDDHSRWGQESENSIQRDIWRKRLADACEAVSIRESCKLSGGIPLGAERLLKELRRPQTDWRTVLQDFVQEEITDYSFMPPDRRMDDSPFFLPDFNEKEDFAADILFMIDTSGSITDDMIAAAYSEIRGAIDRFNGRLRGWLGFFDADITEPEPFADAADLMSVRPKGGGGTAFDIIFSYVRDRMQDQLPAGIVILTDGCAPFPDEKETMGIPVLWLLNNEEVTPPWGKTARIRVHSSD